MAGQRHWLRVQVTGKTSNRRGIGATVRLPSASGTQTQVVRSGSSYASQSELTLTFGLGTDTRVSRLEVVWPSGKTQALTDLSADQSIQITEP